MGRPKKAKKTAIEEPKKKRGRPSKNKATKEEKPVKVKKSKEEPTNIVDDSVYQVFKIVFQKWRYADKTEVCATAMVGDDNIPFIVAAGENEHGKAKLIESRTVEIQRRHAYKPEKTEDDE